MTKLVFASVFALGMAACASTPSTEVASLAPQNKGMVTVAGISAPEALGSVDTSKLVGSKPNSVTSNQPAVTTEATSQTAPAEGAIAVEGVSPASVLGAVDTSKLVDGADSKASDGE